MPGNGLGGKEAGEEEEVPVADEFLYPAGHHAGEHHAECHEAGAEGVVGSLLLACAEEHHEVGEDGETKAVAQLLDGDAGGNHRFAFGMGVCQIEVDKVREIHGADHLPQAPPQAAPGNEDAAQDAARREGNDPYGAINEPHGGSIQSQAAGGRGIQQERRGDFDQLRLGKAIEQDERQGRDDAGRRCRSLRRT